jgi:two-component system cell cycle response regulator DivK
VFPHVKASILLVDDDSSVRRSLVRLLLAHGYEVFEVDKVAAALEILSTKLPAVMLMDMLLAGEDGMEAVRRIKKDPRTATVPIIAVTASPPGAPRDRALFANILPKPSDSRALLDAIAAAVRAREVP